MDLTRPEPPALPPGVIARHTPWYRRAWDLGVRYRWEALPYYAAAGHGCTVELYAYLDPPGAGELAAFSLAAALSAGGAVLCAAKDWTKGMVVTTGLTAAMGWTAWQAADPSPIAGLIMMGPLATAAGIPYWRLLAAARTAQIEREHEVEMGKLDVMKAHAAAGRIPGQREAPAIESVAAAPAEPASETWPTPPPGLDAAAPVPLSRRTSIQLVGGHILVGGGTDAGKSNIVHAIACALLGRRRVRILGVDMKPGAVELGVYRKTGARIASTKADALDLLAWVRDEGIRRGEIMGATIHDEGTLTRSWTATDDDPHLVLFIDELAELVDVAPDAAKILKSHTRLLRAMGITVVAATQSPSRAVFGGDTDARGQYGTRICVATFEPTQTNIILGQGAHGAGWRADQLDGRGDFLVQSRNHRDPAPDRSYHVTDDILAARVNACAATGPAAHRDAEPEAFPTAAEPAFESTGSVTGDILAYLADRAATPKEVADAIGHPKPDAVRARMSQMREARQLVRDDQGRYAATKTGKVIASNVVDFQQRESRRSARQKR